MGIWDWLDSTGTETTLYALTQTQDTLASLEMQRWLLRKELLKKALRQMQPGQESW